MEIVTKIAPIGLALIMRSLGMSLKIRDFLRVVKIPQDILIGFFCQVVLLPIIPFILILVTSILMGVKIRTMWMSPFYLFFGVLSIYIFQNKINLKKLRGFIYFFLFLFILAPVTYSYISISEKNKRTDYPGKKISKIVQKQWDEKFKNKIVLVSGDEWHAGNLSYHLETRPKWDNILSNNKNISSKSMKGGFILVANPDILNKICNGIFFKIHTQGFCMVGINK